MTALLLTLALQEDVAREFTKTWDAIGEDYLRQLFEITRTDLPGRPAEFEKICEKGRSRFSTTKDETTFTVNGSKVLVQRGKASWSIELENNRVRRFERPTGEEEDCRFPFPMILRKKPLEIGRNTTALEAAQAYVNAWTNHVAACSEAFLKFLDDVERRLKPCLASLDDLARARRELRAEGEKRGEKGWATLKAAGAEGPFEYVLVEMPEGKQRLKLAKAASGWEPRALQSPCISCPANGKCRLCEGTGKLAGERCDGCSGTGTCSLCEGTGWLR